jgi:hypothetical protein
MDEAITIHFGRPIPVFPLNLCVLLPHAGLPLHIFEPRYRQMVSDVLDKDGLIAMGQFAVDITSDEYERGRPLLKPIVCVGYVEQYEKLEDGRFLVLLRGLCRARILEELPTDPYRRFYLDPLEVPPFDEVGLSAHRIELGMLLDDPVFTRVINDDERTRLFDESVPTPALIDVLIGRFCDEVEQRYALLAEADAKRRADWVIGRMRELRKILHHC